MSRRARDENPPTAEECLTMIRAMMVALPPDEADKLRDGLSEFMDLAGGTDGDGPDVDGGTRGGMVQNLPRSAQDRLAADRRASARDPDGFARRHPGAARIKIGF